MNVLYFAFANQPDRPLKELTQEDNEIDSLLSPLAARYNFRVIRDSNATLKSVTEKLSLFKDDLILFHYSGHASPETLELLDISAQSNGIAALLAECKKLQLVVLNGCATGAQVQELQRLNIPLVIATHRPVEDKKAASFAIHFYRSLSLFNHVEDAFNTARGHVLSIDSSLKIERGLALRIAPSPPNEHCWGLFGLVGRETEAKWVLPANIHDQELEQFRPNELLLQALLEALAPHRTEIANILAFESDGISTFSLTEKRKLILEALPHPISELVRYLLVPKSAGSPEVFFDQIGIGRLQQIYAVYLTIIELMAFIMLAQLWDVLHENRENKIPIPEELSQQIRCFLMAHAQERLRFDHIRLIQSIRIWMEPLGKPSFVEELLEMKEKVQPGASFIQSDQFFRDLELSLFTMPEQQAKLLCITAEEHLANAFKDLGFITRYTFASVKNIDVLKYRHQQKPLFRHSVVKLKQRFVGLEAEPQIIQGMMDSASVLLLKESKEDEWPFLNLSPFIIDQNAFDDKATVAKLHFFTHYNFEQDAYFFRHIYMAKDLPLMIQAQPIYRIIKVQFEALAQLLFQNPMKNLRP